LKLGRARSLGLLATLVPRRHVITACLIPNNNIKLYKEDKVKGKELDLKEEKEKSNIF
jgi:hypothetical protein